MGSFWQALANKQTTILGMVVIIGSLAKILFTGNDTVIDQLVGNLQTILTNVIQFGIGIGLLLAKDGRTGSPPPGYRGG
jgi:hypothetical protein